MIITAIYVMVGSGFEKKYGFWRSLIWPYYLGKILGSAVERRAALERSEG